MALDSADVVIIGAGVTGLSSGFWLTRAGLDVAVVEQGIGRRTYPPSVDRLEFPAGFAIATASGRGFGLWPAIGEAVSELVTKGTTAIPIEGLALRRFAGLEPSWRQSRRWDAGAWNT